MRLSPKGLNCRGLATRRLTRLLVEAVVGALEALRGVGIAFGVGDHVGTLLFTAALFVLRDVFAKFVEREPVQLRTALALGELLGGGAVRELQPSAFLHRIPLGAGAGVSNVVLSLVRKSALADKLHALLGRGLGALLGGGGGLLRRVAIGLLRGLVGTSHL